MKTMNNGVEEEIKFSCFICRERLLTVCYVEFEMCDLHYCSDCVEKNKNGVPVLGLIDLDKYEFLCDKQMQGALVIADELDYGLVLLSDEW